ncbi:2-dehydro-3-deoxygalactonokinase [Alphaproteobacteria bacterium]|nr:2-dehydro-3-deoxygalactonokinase [Alphaproteobacteria bacterium]
MNKWIAVDWGTSSFRAYLIENDIVSDRIETKDGMKFIDNNSFEKTFISLIENWLVDDQTIDVLASGMVGARQGWVEAPYQKTPCDLNNIKFISPTINDNRIALKIFSGISQIDQPDVMRGEETQVAGFFYENPDFVGSICLPGTHTKWIKVKDRIVEKFQTFMTGELFEVISQNTVLMHSVKSNKIDQEEILKSVEIIFKDPSLFGNALFQLRADDLINSKDSVIYKSRLSGYLLGLELLGCMDYWKKSKIALIGNRDLVKLYNYILKNKGSSIIFYESEDMTLKGLKYFKEKIR